MNRIENQANEAGVPHWKWQRRSAIVLIPLTLWVLVSIIHHIGLDYAQSQAWLANPVVALFLLIFVCALFFHAKLGLQVIIEDYISDQSARRAILRISNLICWIAMFVGAASIIKIAIAT